MCVLAGAPATNPSQSPAHFRGDGEQFGHQGQGAAADSCYLRPGLSLPGPSLLRPVPVNLAASFLFGLVQTGDVQASIRQYRMQGLIPDRLSMGVAYQ